MLGRLIGPRLCQQLLTFPRLMVIATSYWLSINMGIARALQSEREGHGVLRLFSCPELAPDIDSS